MSRALELAGEGAFVIDGEGRLVLWNRAAEEIMGYRPHEVIGRRCRDVFVGQHGDRDRLCCRRCHLLRLVRQLDSIQSFDLHTRTKAGKPVWINVGMLPIGADASAGPSTIHLFCDVTACREPLQLVSKQVAPSPDDGDVAASLTRREIEVLRLMTCGVNTAAAAKQLCVSPATIRNHVQNIFGKLDVHSRLEAVAYARQYGIV